MMTTNSSKHSFCSSLFRDLIDFLFLYRSQQLNEKLEINTKYCFWYTVAFGIGTF